MAQGDTGIDSEFVVKVSVVVPVYNTGLYLHECIDSIVNQTLREIEIICVNDGSTDNSLDILKSYAAIDGRVKIIDKDNAGYGHSMNIGMDAASGEFIGIVESDDYILPEMYETLYRIAKNERLDFIKADFKRFWNNTGGGRDFQYIGVADREYYNKALNPNENRDVFKFNKQTWCGIYNAGYLRKFSIRHNETPGASYQDNGFFIKTYCRATKIYLLDKPFYMHRLDNPDSSINNKEKVYCIKTEYDLTAEYLKEFPDTGNELWEFFYYSKFKSYMFTVKRINSEYKEAFIRHFSGEFKEAKNEGKLYRPFFNDYDWMELNWIIDDPDGYYSFQFEPGKISVVIPAYNVAKTLPRCLDSVISQTLKEIEILCINDGSTDATLDVLNRYALADRRIVVLSQKNRGAGLARNFGIENARGGFVIFMDPDDFYPDDDVLESLYDKAVKHNAQICGGCFSNICNGTVNAIYKGINNGYTFDEEGTVEYEDYQFDFGFQRFIYKRDMLIEHDVRFPDYKRYQDPPFFVNAMIAAGNFYAVPKVVYRYSDSETTWNTLKVMDLMRGVRDVLRISAAYKYQRLHANTYRRIVFRHVFPIARHYDKNNLEYLGLINELEDAIDPLLLEPEGVGYVPVKDLLLADFQNEYRILKKEADFLKSEIHLIIGSWTYKIGRFCTFIPRRLRQLSIRLKGRKST